MDDGSAEYAGLSLQTHSFSTKDIDLLMEAIKLNFEIDVLTHKNKGKDIIYFSKRNIERLRILVDPYILPEFKYKLNPISMRNRPRRDCTPDPIQMGYDTVRSL